MCDVVGTNFRADLLSCRSNYYSAVPSGQEQKVRSLLIVDVRDVAKAHVAAASGKATGERFIVSPEAGEGPPIMQPSSDRSGVDFVEGLLDAFGLSGPGAALRLKFALWVTATGAPATGRGGEGASLSVGLRNHAKFASRSSGTLAQQVLYVQQLCRLLRQSHPACATCIKGDRQRPHRELQKASSHKA